jgi:hypothetical protein
VEGPPHFAFASAFAAFLAFAFALAFAVAVTAPSLKNAAVISTEAAYAM